MTHGSRIISCSFRGSGAGQPGCRRMTVTVRLLSSMKRRPRYRAAMAFVLLACLVSVACAERHDASGSIACHEGWTTLDSVIGLPDGTAIAAGTRCTAATSHVLVRRWNGERWLDSVADDAGWIYWLTADNHGTVYGLASNPASSAAASLVRINGDAVIVEHKFASRMTSVSAAPNGTIWVSGFQDASTGGASQPDHPSPTILFERGSKWVATAWGGVT